ncbi:hypothetical protein ACLOJK_025796 [Asimina triloba]
MVKEFARANVGGRCETEEYEKRESILGRPWLARIRMTAGPVDRAGAEHRLVLPDCRRPRPLALALDEVTAKRQEAVGSTELIEDPQILL